MKNLPSFLYFTFGLALLFYMTAPGPNSINDFAPLPDAVSSKLSGDTSEVPELTAYFSDNYRDFVTQFYYDDYKNLSRLPFGPIKLNHPPEMAFEYVKDQTQSTYLEEILYPLRGSLYVNGMEPLEEDGTPRYKGAIPFVQDGESYSTKTTLRYYPIDPWVKFAVWVGIMFSLFILWKITKKVYAKT